MRVKTCCNTYLDHYELGLRIALTFLVFEDEPVRGDVEFEHTFSDAPYVRRNRPDSLAPVFASAAFSSRSGTRALSDSLGSFSSMVPILPKYIVNSIDILAVTNGAVPNESRYRGELFELLC